MSENLYFYKGLESNLPKSGIIIGGLYHCTDTKNTYIGISTTKMELWANGAIKRHTVTREDGTQIIAGAGTETTVASGALSFAEGNLTNALGTSSHAEGEETYAFGRGAHAEGYYDFTPQNWRLKTSDPERKVWIAGNLGSAVVGGYVKLENTFLKIQAINNATRTVTLSDSAPGTSVQDVTFEYYGKIGAYGNYAHTEGNSTGAIGDNSHAEGLCAIANGNSSHAEGDSTRAFGNGSHAEGINTFAWSEKSHAEGYGGNLNSDFYWYNMHKLNDSDGTIWVCENIAEDNDILAEIDDFVCFEMEDDYYKIIAIDNNNKTITINKPLNTTSSGYRRVTILGKIGAYGVASHAEGERTSAVGIRAHAEGYRTAAIGNNSHAEGFGTKALGHASHAEG
jgi:hypothetical protein